MCEGLKKVFIYQLNKIKPAASIESFLRLLSFSTSILRVIDILHLLSWSKLNDILSVNLLQPNAVRNPT